MSALSSLFPSRLLGSAHARDRSSDPLARLRFTLETMPGSRKYVFSPATRAEILSELYDSFWGPYAHLFMPNPNPSFPNLLLLSQVQLNAGILKDQAPVPGMFCGHIFKKGECCFRCKDCALDDSCVLCTKCFEATDHSGHNVSFFIAQQPGGCCDCGDVEAWRTPIQCPHHPLSATANEALNSFTLKTLQTTPRVSPKVITGQDIPPVSDYPYRAPVPPELRDTMSRTIAYALDFVLDTLDFSPDQCSIPTSEADLRSQPSGDPMLNDYYCVIIWNDDKHSFEEVNRLLHDITNRSKEEAEQLTNRLDDQGRDIIEMNFGIPRLLEMAQTIGQIDLGVTVRRAYDTFREQVSAVIIEWLLDLTRSRLGADALILREMITSELLSSRTFPSLTSSQEANKVFADIHEPARLDWLFLYHTKWWKKPRLNLKEIMVSLISLSPEHRLAIASHFASAYPRIIDAYLLVDREAETSTKYFALQVFTVPSVALYIARQHNVISRLLAMLTAFFTNRIRDKRIILSSSDNTEIEIDTFPFRSKRFMPVFSDLRYLCHNDPVQQLIAHNHELIAQFAKMCQIFMCMNPNKRAASSHVEYETDAWISVFNVTLSLSRVIKVFGEAFSRATVAELVAAITTVIHHILTVTTQMEERRDSARYQPVSFHTVSFGASSYRIVDFNVMEGWVSFHQSLQWLLAELLKHVDILSEESLNQIGLTSIRDVCLRNANDDAILTVIDYPLRVLAMIAQIRTGLWVRNGFAIRGQLMHYRDFMLRELCYDQDLFILQAALAILDPNTVIISMLDRFQLLGYFSGVTLHQMYDANQIAGMVEEFLYILIAALTERANATKMSLPVAVRREIVHALAVGPCTFTDLIKRVAERMVDDACFERVLKEVAVFKPPEAVSDSGTYELKDDAFDEVNPFFYHYSRNKREEVDVVLRNRLKKKTGVQEPVIVPKPLDITSGPFSTVVSVFESEVFLQIVFYGLYNVLVLTDSSGTTPPSAEAIYDQILHLVMVSLVERPHVFSNLAIFKTFEEEKNLVDIICALEHHDKYKPFNARVQWILTEIERYVPEEVQARRVHTTPDSDFTNAKDAKKRAAKARQDAIMRQMKMQQDSFATNFEDLEDEDDDDVGNSADSPVSYGTCIVCQEELNASKAFGYLGFLQPSRLLRRQPDGHHVYMNDAVLAAESLDRVGDQPVDTSFPPPGAEARSSKTRKPHDPDQFPTQYTRFGIHASVCSHLMHLECFTIYSGSIRQRHRSQTSRNQPESIARKEYLCPLCKSLGNVILPAANWTNRQLSSLPFSDWNRAVSISLLKSKPDLDIEKLQLRNGTGEFVFWSAQDSGYQSFIRVLDKSDSMEVHKMVDTVMVVAKNISQQSRHLRDRLEPEGSDRGAGMYLPDELVGYTVSSLEVAQRGQGLPNTSIADNLTDAQIHMIQGLITCLIKLVSLTYKGRTEEGCDAVRQAIVKRLLPEWSRTSPSSFAYPLLLRDPFTLLVETAAVAPDMLRHVLILTYYACLARTVIGLVYALSKTRSHHIVPVEQRRSEDIFGDIHIFFMSVVRHSAVFEQAADIAFQNFGEARIEKLLYSFTLPFLRRAAILCRAVLPNSFPTISTSETSEYSRLLAVLGIPPLSDLPNQEPLQNVLSGWCQHYGNSHAAMQLHCGVTLDYPAIYRFTPLPLVLDSFYLEQETYLVCTRCKAVPYDPAICLMCGKVCCFQTYCCTENDRGECNMHTRECSGAIGMFFLVRRCTILYLYANNGTFIPTPYLDIHGEVDVSMRRGRRQYLHHPRFEEVRKVWLNHGIPTLIARRLESTVDNGGWETL